jgi:hypothetical protein
MMCQNCWRCRPSTTECAVPGRITNWRSPSGRQAGPRSCCEDALGGPVVYLTGAEAQAIVSARGDRFLRAFLELWTREFQKKQA